MSRNWVGAALIVACALQPVHVQAETLEQQLDRLTRKYDEVWYRPPGVFEQMFVCTLQLRGYHRQHEAVAEAMLAWAPYWPPAVTRLAEAQLQLGELEGL